MNPNHVPVFRFKIWNHLVGNMQLAPRPGKREAIERIGGFVLIDTSQEVDSSDLDGNGFLKREKMHA